MIIHFRRPKDFLAELVADRLRVERRIVRFDIHEAPLRDTSSPFTVVATARVDDTILRLDYPVPGDGTGERASAIEEDLKKSVGAAEFELRAGIFEWVA